MRQGESKVIGIDLGTTNSVVAYVEGGEPVVIPNAEGSNKTPSVVAFLDGGDVVVGEIARRQAATNPKRTVYSIKRLMGRAYEDVLDSGDVFTFSIVDQDGNILIDVDGMGYRPEQISALILKKLKECAEASLGEEVTQAIITVPAYFDDLQRNATMEAAKMAGLEVLRLINEPTAAALAYGLGREEEEMVAVYDFGGGTFDISILEVAPKTIEVLTSTGDSHLGGDDLDNAIVHMIIEEFQARHGVDLTQDQMTLRRLKEVAEKAKCELSTMTQTMMSLPFIAYKGNQPLHLERMLTRQEFESLIDEFVERTIRCCRRALEEAGVAKKDISKVILVGGTTRIPLVQEAVEDFFGLPPFKGVNPDEIVALGAATQGGVFEGNIQEVVLLDVTPHSLGIEVKNGRYSCIIDKNSTIPIRAAKMFTTTENNQTFVNIHILQGENPNAADNRSLGKFALTDIPAAPAGAARIRVTFFINTDGVMEITATELSSGKEKTLQILHTDLSEEEKDKRRRRRTRRSGRASIGARRPMRRAEESGGAVAAEGILEGVKVRRDASGTQPPVPPGSAPAPAPPKPREELPAPMFRMVGETDAPPAAAAGAALAPAPTSPAAPAEVPAPAAAAPSPVPATPRTPRSSLNDSPTLIAQEIAGDSDVTPLPSTSERPSTPMPRAILSAPAQALWPYVEKNRDDPAALRALEDGLPALQAFVASHPQATMDAIALARVHLLLGQAEEARQTLLSLHPALSASTADPALEAYNILFNRFPSLAQARRDRSLLHERLGNIPEAIRDLEDASRRDSAPEDTQALERLYSLCPADAAYQFKRVKLLLKDNRLDEAIAILNVLQSAESYRARALKVLGLCFWQKGQRIESWQKFRQLPLNDEVMDIIYRLALDMESAGELNEAGAIFERILSENAEYRDVKARLKKIDYRMKLADEERDKAFSSQSAAFDDPRFTIIEEINRGSMGIIYKARDKVLDEIVVLKVLNDYLCSDPTAVERFKREARAAKRLSHPHIVRIHDMFQTRSKLFISMEYIQGTDLKRLLADQTSFPEDRILKYFLQICDALAYAHGLGIVHRDIKPANIMITLTDQIKITDFGIAKILQADDATKSGTAIIGTPLYMAPEQITGEGVDQRSDIYSLGIMLYELVAGNPPFYLGNIEYHHIHTAPPPLPAHTSEKLRRIIMKCIEKQADNRYQAVIDIFNELRNGE